jgi:protein-histidine pros-kinase
MAGPAPEVDPAVLRYRAWVLEHRLRAETELLDRLPEMLAARAADATPAPARTDAPRLEQVAQDLHDGPLQSLIALLLALRAGGGGDPAAVLARVTEGVEACVTELRELIAEIRGDRVAELDLVAAVRKLAGEWSVQTGVEIDFAAPEPPPVLPVELARALYRIAEEALANAIRHGGAQMVTMRLYAGDSISLMVADDGVGFDVAQAQALAATSGRSGLAGMRRRAAELGGSVAIRSRPGQGTRLIARLPAPAGSPQAGRAALPPEVDWEENHAG